MAEFDEESKRILRGADRMNKLAEALADRGIECLESEQGRAIREFANVFVSTSMLAGQAPKGVMESEQEYHDFKGCICAAIEMFLFEQELKAQTVTAAETAVKEAVIEEGA